MTRTLYDYLVIDPEPYNEKYGRLSDGLTEKQETALQTIADHAPESLKMTVPEFLEEEELFDASRHWFRTLLYRFPASWFADKSPPVMDVEMYEEWFGSGEHGKKFPWSDNGYVCSVDDCDFETHWRSEAKQHEEDNEHTSYGKPVHETVNADLEAIMNGNSTSSSGSKARRSEASVKELILEWTQPYKDRWGSPRSDPEHTWPLQDVPKLREMGHDISYDMTVSEFVDALETINEERRQRDEQDDDFTLNEDDDSIAYDTFVNESPQWIRKFLLRRGPSVTGKGVNSEPVEEFRDEGRTLKFVDNWSWQCDCGKTFDTREEAKQHVKDARDGLKSVDDGYWAHQAKLDEVDN